VTIQSDEVQVIERILTTTSSIAVVGLSGNPERPSHRVAHYLQSVGHRIIPVNPTLAEALGEKASADLLSIPEPVDVVDIFRRPDAVPDIVDQTIRIGAKAVWMQEGLRHPEAAQRAEAAGLLVVMDHRMMKETKRLIAAGTLPLSPSKQRSGARRVTRTRGQ
jgi:predicted CoA-binding protein